MSCYKVFRLTVTLVMVVTAALSANPARVAQAATVCVEPTGAGGCYTTLQAAINAASDNDTINVAAGTYTENVVVSKSVTLAGAGAGSTIVRPAVSNPNPCTGSSLCGGAASNVFLVQANNVIIHDLTVDGDNPTLAGGFDVGGANVDARNGIIKNTNATYNALEVYNVAVQNIYLRGIYSTGGSFNFHNNTVTNVQGDGSSIAMFAWGGPGTMANNTVAYANDGISANHSNGIQFLNNTVSNSGSGVHTDNSGDGGGGADLIQGNTVVNCSPDGYGIWVFVPYIAPTVNNNTVTNCAIGLSAWGQGAAVTTQFTNNTVTGPGKAAESVGAYITTDLISWGYTDVSVNFSGNVITDFDTGVFLTADQQAWNPEPYLGKTVNTTFHSNQINGNTKGADKGMAGVYGANFVKNWWGAASGPSGVGPGTGDTIVTGFDYSPWCADVACTDPSLAFNPTSASMDVGGHAAINIDLNLITDLYGYQFQVNYDASKVSAAGSFINSFFDTVGGVVPTGWNASCAAGVCKFAVSKQAPASALSGSGALAQITFTGVASGLVPLTFSSDILGDRDGNALPHTVGTATLTVNGSATVSGVVNLQGRALPGPHDTLGTVTLTTAGFAPIVATIAANGTWSAVVPVAPGGSLYQLDAAHSLYLGNRLTGVALMPGDSYTTATTKLLGGDADNSGLIDVSDLSCIGGAFGGGAVTCGTTGSSDINADGSTNILDLVLAGGNFELATPRGW